MRKVTIGLVGLGSIGAWVYSFLATRPEEVQVIVLADTERAERLTRQGISINGIHHDLTVKAYDDFASQEEPLDYLLLATKMNALPEVLQAVKPWVSEKTQLVPLQNGISSERLAAELYGWDRVIYAIAFVAADKEGRETHFHSQGLMTIGEASQSTLAPARIQDLADILRLAGMNVKVSESIVRDSWLKFLSNCTNNQYLAILNVPYPALAKSPDLLALMRDLGQEVVALGQAEGVTLTNDDVERMLTRSAGFQSDAYPSTAQDLRAKRPTEVDTFSGECIRLGEKHGIPTPYSRTVYHLIRVLEQKNAGDFGDLN